MLVAGGDPGTANPFIDSVCRCLAHPRITTAHSPTRKRAIHAAFVWVRPGFGTTAHAPVQFCTPALFLVGPGLLSSRESRSTRYSAGCIDRCLRLFSALGLLIWWGRLGSNQLGTSRPRGYSPVPYLQGVSPIATKLERVGGIEPPSSAWKAPALPLSYTRLGAGVLL